MGTELYMIIQVPLFLSDKKMPSSFPIKYAPLTWSDYAEARTIFRQTFAYSEWARLSTAWRSRAVGWVARYRGVLVGFSLADTDNTVKYIAVHPEFQAYKIGSGLLTRLLGELTDARSIRLQTAGDTRLVGWYGRFGFRAESELYTDDGDFLGAFMVKRQRCRSAGH